MAIYDKSLSQYRSEFPLSLVCIHFTLG